VIQIYFCYAMHHQLGVIPETPRKEGELEKGESKAPVPTHNPPSAAHESSNPNELFSKAPSKIHPLGSPRKIKWNSSRGKISPRFNKKKLAPLRRTLKVSPENSTLVCPTCKYEWPATPDLYFCGNCKYSFKIRARILTKSDKK
jgi:hypothetical protein